MNYMDDTTRREFLKNAGAVASGIGVAELSAGTTILSGSTKKTGVRIEGISHGYEEYLYRTANKFAGTVVDRATIMTVKCTVRTSAGKVAEGFGSMPLGNVWSFPSKKMPYAATLSAMKALAEEIAKITGSYKEFEHPIDINWALNPLYLKAAAEVSLRLHLPDPIPKLCTLVTASPFDAAVHDAFGKAHGLNCYHSYGPQFMTYDLSHYLGPEFRGEQLTQYILQKPTPRMPMYHLIGALDALVDADLKQRIDDGLPNTLPEWIRYNGLSHFKIKLNGDDLKWDVDRVITVGRVVQGTQSQRGVDEWVLSLDFNEKCPNVGYLLDFLHQVKETSALTYDRIQYIEQPTARELETHRDNVMHEAAKLKPDVIDESLTGLDRLLLAREMGYSGVALKSCKGQSQSVLLAAAGQKYKMFLCVQDLTCPGMALLESAGLAAHVPGADTIEANAREYVPAANRPWEKKFPGIFIIKDGTMRTNKLSGPGLGAEV